MNECKWYKFGIMIFMDNYFRVKICVDIKFFFRGWGGGLRDNFVF